MGPGVALGGGDTQKLAELGGAALFAGSATGGGPLGLYRGAVGLPGAVRGLPAALRAAPANLRAYPGKLAGELGAAAARAKRCLERVRSELRPTRPSGAAKLNVSKYDTLNIGSTGERPNGSNVLHVNIEAADLPTTSVNYKGEQVPLNGGRLIADGTNLDMLPSGHFKHVQANHIPGDATLATGIIGEGYRTLQPGGTASFSSSSLSGIDELMTAAGFTDITPSQPVRTIYNGKVTMPAIQYNGVKPR